MLKELPIDILEIILAFLPSKDVLQVGSTNKNLKLTIKESRFWKRVRIHVNDSKTLRQIDQVSFHCKSLEIYGQDEANMEFIIFLEHWL